MKGTIRHKTKQRGGGGLYAMFHASGNVDIELWVQDISGEKRDTAMSHRKLT